MGSSAGGVHASQPNLKATISPNAPVQTRAAPLRSWWRLRHAAMDRAVDGLRKGLWRPIFKGWRRRRRPRAGDLAEGLESGAVEASDAEASTAAEAAHATNIAKIRNGLSSSTKFADGRRC